MSSSSGSVQQTAGSLVVSGDVNVAGAINVANSSHPPQPPPGSGGLVPPPHLDPVPPPGPSDDHPIPPPVPFPAPIEALGGYVGPYFQVGKTTWSVHNQDYFPGCGPFYTPGLLTIFCGDRRSNAAGTPSTGRGSVTLRMMLLWGTQGLPIAVSPATTGGALNSVGDVGALLPTGVVDLTGAEITVANPIPAGSPTLLLRQIDNKQDVMQWFGPAVGGQDATLPIPAFIPLSLNSQISNDPTIDISWMFQPIDGYTGQVVPIIPIPASFTKVVGQPAQGNRPQPWAVGQTYPAGIVVISNDSTGRPTYWMATSLIVNPSTAANQPGLPGAVFPVVQWTIFGT